MATSFQIKSEKENSTKSCHFVGCLTDDSNYGYADNGYEKHANDRDNDKRSERNDHINDRDEYSSRCVTSDRLE